MKRMMVGRSRDFWRMSPSTSSRYGATEKCGLAVTHVNSASRSAKPRTHAAWSSPRNAHTRAKSWVTGRSARYDSELARRCTYESPSSPQVRLKRRHMRPMMLPTSLNDMNAHMLSRRRAGTAKKSVWSPRYTVE
jgi:hypothetical protein